MKLIEMLESYRPYNEQETQDRLMMLKALEALENPLYRENLFAHFTASSWIVNQDRTRVLMAYHNIYKTWAWTGGHADGEENLLYVALREAQEETGIVNVVPVSSSIYSLEALPVPSHFKRGCFISSHIHLNVTFLLTADDRQKIRNKPDENSAVAWFPLADAAENKDEPHMEIIYKKLNCKLSAFHI